MKNLVILFALIFTINLFSFCGSNDDKLCLNFKEINEFEHYSKAIIAGIKIDKNGNKFILFNNPVASSFIIKFDKSNKELWKKSFAFESHDLLLNNKGNLIIIADYSSKLKLGKNIELNSATKALLVLKIDSKTGKLIKYLSVKTNYGVRPGISRMGDENNIYISGIYGGKSKYFEKTGYENSFILVLDNKLNKKWSKTLNKTKHSHISNLKIKNQNIYINLKLRKGNANKVLVLNREAKQLGFVKENKLIDFDVDEDGNIYTINKKNNLKKINKNFKGISIEKMIGLNYSFTPTALVFKNKSLFIKYKTNVNYKSGILIGNYNLDLKNKWFYAIIGQKFSMTNLDVINNKLVLFGVYRGNLLFNNQDYFSSKIIPFIAIFETLK